MTKLSFTLAVAAMMAIGSLGIAQESTSTADRAAAVKAKKEARKAAKEKRATEKRLKRIWKTAQPVEGFESAEMFEAMESGDIDVIIKTIDEKKSNVIVTSKSDKPLAILMPETFAAVPRANLQGGLGAPGGGGGGFGGGGQQGGGFGGGGGGRGGVFNIPPGKVGKVSLTTVCLEHGKPNPTLKMDYTIAPLKAVTSDASVSEICRMLANDEVIQPVAQAASWNITDGLSWQQMLVLNRLERMDGYFERFFSPNQLRFAQQVVAVAAQRAEERQRMMKDDDTATVSVEKAKDIYSQQD
jgi:hypothetical protein